MNTHSIFKCNFFKRLYLKTYFTYSFLKGDFWIFFLYFMQHCFICRPSESTESEDAGIQPRTVATTALVVTRSNHSARSHSHSARSHSYYFHSIPYRTLPDSPFKTPLLSCTYCIYVRMIDVLQSFSRLLNISLKLIINLNICVWTKLPNSSLISIRAVFVMTAER